MKIEHLGVVVDYQESTNTWECEIRGRHRTFESLTKAKAAIEAEPKGKSGAVEKMEPIPVFMPERWGSEQKTGKITSFAEQSRWAKGITEAWVVFGKTRSKESLSSLYPDTPEVREVFNQAAELDKQADDLSVKARELRATINVKPPEA